VILNEQVPNYGSYNLKSAVDFFSRFSLLHKSWSDFGVSGTRNKSKQEVPLNRKYLVILGR
jgi:hypothetical protein